MASKVPSLRTRLNKMSPPTSLPKWQTQPPIPTKRNSNLLCSLPRCSKLWRCYRPKSSSSTIPPTSHLTNQLILLLEEASTNRNFLLAAAALPSDIKAAVTAAAAATKTANATQSSTAGPMAVVAILVLRATRNYLGIKMPPRSLIKWAATPITAPDGGGLKLIM
jgi:hypothetical protein